MQQALHDVSKWWLKNINVFAGISASCVLIRAQNLTTVPPREITRCGVRVWCLQHSLQRSVAANSKMAWATVHCGMTVNETSVHWAAGFNHHWHRLSARCQRKQQANDPCPCFRLPRLHGFCHERSQEFLIAKSTIRLSSECHAPSPCAPELRTSDPPPPPTTLDGAGVPRDLPRGATVEVIFTISDARRQQLRTTISAQPHAHAPTLTQSHLSHAVTRRANVCRVAGSLRAPQKCTREPQASDVAAEPSLTPVDTHELVNAHFFRFVSLSLLCRAAAVATAAWPYA